MSKTISCLTALAVLYLAMASAVGAAQEQPLGRTAIERYLFLPDSDTYLIGDRITRWESDVFVLLYREDERALVAEVAAEINGAKALGPRQIVLLPPIDEVREGTGERPNFALGVDSAFFEFMMAPGGLRGLESYQAHAEAIGCYAQPSVPLIARDYVIAGGQIMTRDDLDPAALRDCLFRGFLLNAGLMYTERLAFRDAPLNAAERAEALAVLALIYHPAVRPGMTKAAFFRALEAEGKIGR